MLSLEQVLTDDNRQEIAFPPPCPTEAVEGVKEAQGLRFLQMVYPGHGFCINNCSLGSDPANQPQRSN